MGIPETIGKRSRAPRPPGETAVKQIKYIIMKNLVNKFRISLGLAFLLALVVALNSCKKEVAENIGQADSSVTTGDFGSRLNKSTIDSRSESQSCDDLLSEVELVDGMLRFNDFEHFQSVQQCLEDALEAHNQAFEDQYGYLPDNELNDLIEEIGFDEFQPLSQFEQSKSFYSLRNMINAQVVEWLNHPELDFDNDPNDQANVSAVVQSLLNTQGKIMIDGKVYDINDESNETGTPENTCVSIAKTEQEYTHNDHKFKLTLRLRFPWQRYASVQTDIHSYQRKASGNNWRLFRTQLNVGVGGDVRDVLCERNTGNIPMSFRNRRGTSLTVEIGSHQFPVILIPTPSYTRIGSCEISGQGWASSATNNQQLCL